MPDAVGVCLKTTWSRWKIGSLIIADELSVWTHP
jgi:hypothetical protein